MNDKQRILILCTGNSARSQMAEGLLRHDGGAAFEVESAGVEPSFVRPHAIEAMREVGIDISGHRSKPVDEFAGQEFDYVITVCDSANERCPVFPGKTERIHWSFDDPASAVGDEAAKLAFFPPLFIQPLSITSLSLPCFVHLASASLHDGEIFLQRIAQLVEVGA